MPHDDSRWIVEFHAQCSAPEGGGYTRALPTNVHTVVLVIETISLAICKCLRYGHIPRPLSGVLRPNPRPPELIWRANAFSCGGTIIISIREDVPISLWPNMTRTTTQGFLWIPTSFPWTIRPLNAGEHQATSFPLTRNPCFPLNSILRPRRACSRSKVPAFALVAELAKISSGTMRNLLAREHPY